MTTLSDIQPEIDAKGFLVDPQAWDADVAAVMAARLGVAILGAAHWRVVQHLRELYLCRDDPLLQRQICRELEWEPNCISTLFGGLVEASQVAGLPEPGHEVLAHMSVPASGERCL
ncbi:MAG: TusE/DsrC/DsvC family sulfur relay protein [Thiohalocapsa sp.]|jgi:tRNA 2-thiouridine synthesizing protein E|uniref:TusE/DsrC/DsvC family sulfur relay protein n=1 Tax=Thiohalocapsa sp. TaxID=2497641 RepID=UPI0025E19E30|nr:TusE/DsrC/DsvC family sulfur relay protein [Thiohalocapsa sp.]MCG6942371.1 TusE/DsrC/DsvC family sulfur relay protein [Thiohalocapsa sp.]